MRRMQEMLKKHRPVPVFGYGGRAFDLHPELRDQVPGVYLGSTLDAAVASVHDLLKPKARTAHAS